MALGGGGTSVTASFRVFPGGSTVPPPPRSCAPAAALLAHSHSRFLSWPVVATSLKLPRSPSWPVCFPSPSVRGNGSHPLGCTAHAIPAPLSAPACCWEPLSAEPCGTHVPEVWAWQSPRRPPWAPAPPPSSADRCVQLPASSPEPTGRSSGIW